MPKAKFSYQIPDWHDADEWRSVMAYDAEEAAEKAGEIYDSDGDSMLSRDENNDVQVTIRAPDGAASVWRVSAAHHVTYSARKDRDDG